MKANARDMRTNTGRLAPPRYEKNNAPRRCFRRRKQQNHTTFKAAESIRIFTGIHKICFVRDFIVLARLSRHLSVSVNFPSRLGRKAAQERCGLFGITIPFSLPSPW